MSDKITGNSMIPIYAGNSIELEFTVRKDSQLVDLTGLAGKFKVFLDVPGEDETFVIDKSLTIPTQTGDALGTCSCVLTGNETDQYTSVYKYYLVFTYGVSDDRVLQEGTVKIIGDDTDRINQIKLKYGLDFDYYTMREALNYAQSQLLNNGYEYVEKIIDTLDSNHCFLIENYVMDKNFDEVVDDDDIYLFEYQSESPYTINNLSSHISNITFNHPKGMTIVQMDGTYPSDSSYKMQIQYYKGLQSFSYLNNDIKYLEELYAIYHLFDVLPIYKLQHGITKRNINGINVEFNHDSIRTLMVDLRDKILYQISKIRSLSIKPVIINKNYGYNNSPFNYGFDYSASRYRDFNRRF